MVKWRQVGRRARVVLAVAAGVGLIVVAAGLVVDSPPITLQGAAIALVGVAGLLVGWTPPRVPRPAPRVLLPLAAGTVVLVVTAAANQVRGFGELSPALPAGLLVGVGLLALAVRGLPRPPAPGGEPNGSVLLVVVALVTLAGYAVMRTGFPDADLPGYLVAIALPLLAAAAAGATAVLAARRGGAATLAAAGALILVSTALMLADEAGAQWWGSRWTSSGDWIFGAAVSVSDNGGAPIEIPPVGPATVVTVLIVFGSVLVVAGWWWAAVRGGGILRPSSEPT